MKVLSLDCQFSAVAVTDDVRAPRARGPQVVEAEASVYAASDGELALIVAVAVGLIGMFRTGFGRC